MTEQDESLLQLINVPESVDEQFDRPFTWPAGKAAAIGYVDGVFEESFCASLIDYCLRNWHRSKPGRTVGGTMLDTKVSHDFHLNPYDPDEGFTFEVDGEYDRRIFNRLWRVVNLYQSSFSAIRANDPSNHFAVNDSGYQIQRYSQCSGYYSDHIDGAAWLSSFDRTLGVIIYLNTVDDGGGTNFPEHRVTVDAVAGRVALFPSLWTHPHAGLMPMSSDKWIISTFIRCEPFNPAAADECQCMECTKRRAG